MELKSGYKQTEVGVIPEDWLTLTYGKVFDFLKTATYSRAEVRSTEGVLYVHYGDIHTEWDGFVDFNTANVCCVTDEQAKAYSLLKNGDLIMADASEDYGGIGKSVEVKNLDNRKAISGLHTFVLRDSENIIADGYRGYLHSNKQIKKQFDRLATGMKVFGVSRNNLKTVLIPLPPTKAEQEAIAEALSDADALIASLEQLIAKKRLIKQGAMQELLTGKRRLPGFSGDWEEKTLGETTECLDSVRVPLNESQRRQIAGDIPYCGANGILDYVNDYVIDDDIILMAEDGGYFDEYETRPIAYRMIGKCWVNNHAHVLKSLSGYDQSFLFYSLVHKNILPFLASGTRAKLNKSELNKITVCLPPEKTEQTAIATVLSEMDVEIDALETKLAKARLLKHGMMQELLTGKIRLV